ncbi:MAG: cation transporter [Elusimicrobiales bacterium]|jgi:cation diffusion facilitator family transporter|nr:cation transporter [Elusimicrobiales bacterium]
MNNTDKKKKVARLSVASNTFLVVSKLIIGLMIGSISVISEAIHSSVDLLAAGIALFAVKNSSIPADDEHRFGHGKIENISGFVEALLIFLAAIFIIYESIKKLIHPVPIETIGFGILIMFFACVLNFYVSRMLAKTAKETDSIALKADAMHLTTDIYTSLGVMLGLFLIWILETIFKGHHFHWIDPVTAIIVALMIIKAAYNLTMEALGDLMDSSITKKSLDDISEIISSNKYIKSFKNLKTRKAGNKIFIEFDLVFNNEILLKDAHTITDDITNMIKAKYDADVIVHMEPCEDKCINDCEDNCKVE